MKVVYQARAMPKKFVAQRVVRCPPMCEEVDEARKVTDRVAEVLSSIGVRCTVFHDDTSTSQSQNLDTIVRAHNNAGPHDLDVSVHFNAL